MLSLFFWTCFRTFKKSRLSGSSLFRPLRAAAATQSGLETQLILQRDTRSIRGHSLLSQQHQQLNNSLPTTLHKQAPPQHGHSAAPPACSTQTASDSLLNVRNEAQHREVRTFFSDPTSTMWPRAAGGSH